MADEKLDPNSANLPPQGRADIHDLGLRHVPTSHDKRVASDTFHDPERDVVATLRESNWKLIEAYRDGEVVMPDDGRERLGKREMPQLDYQPMFEFNAPGQIKCT